jgi:hypothetical protein
MTIKEDDLSFRMTGGCLMPIEHTGNVQLSKKENKLLFVENI